MFKIATSQECSDPRNAIYSLRGLYSDTSIVPDYAKERVQLLREVIKLKSNKNCILFGRLLCVRLGLEKKFFWRSARHPVVDRLRLHFTDTEIPVAADESYRLRCRISPRPMFKTDYPDGQDTSVLVPGIRRTRGARYERFQSRNPRLDLLSNARTHPTVVFLLDGTCFALLWNEVHDPLDEKQYECTGLGILIRNQYPHDHARYWQALSGRKGLLRLLKDAFALFEKEFGLIRFE